MFCSECGQPATGKFCCHCGHAIGSTPTPANWRDSLDYQLVAAVPEVRDAVAKALREARQGVNGNQMLQLADGIASSFTGGVSSLAVAKIAQPFYAKFGLRTCRERSGIVVGPPGEALASLLVAIAQQGLTPDDATHDAESCVLRVTMPADLKLLEGTLTVSVKRHPSGTHIVVAAQIDGQWIDWGVCQRRIDRLFASATKAA